MKEFLTMACIFTTSITLFANRQMISPDDAVKIGLVTDILWKPVIDAWTIKYFNGAASWDDDTEKYVGIKGYAEWDCANAVWKLYPAKSYRNSQNIWVRNPYIEKVCEVEQ